MNLIQKILADGNKQSLKYILGIYLILIVPIGIIGIINPHGNMVCPDSITVFGLFLSLILFVFVISSFIYTLIMAIFKQKRYIYLFTLNSILILTLYAILRIIFVVLEIK